MSIQRHARKKGVVYKARVYDRSRRSGYREMNLRAGDTIEFTSSPGQLWKIWPAEWTPSLDFWSTSSHSQASDPVKRSRSLGTMWARMRSRSRRLYRWGVFREPRRVHLGPSDYDVTYRYTRHFTPPGLNMRPAPTPFLRLIEEGEEAGVWKRSGRTAATVTGDAESFSPPRA